MDLFRLVLAEADEALSEAQISMKTARSLLSLSLLDLRFSSEPLSAQFQEITDKTVTAFEAAAFIRFKQ
jgi:hypothetical protein